MSNFELGKFKNKYRLITLGSVVLFFIIFVLCNFSVDEILNSSWIGNYENK